MFLSMTTNDRKQGLVVWTLHCITRTMAERYRRTHLNFPGPWPYPLASSFRRNVLSLAWKSRLYGAGTWRLARCRAEGYIKDSLSMLQTHKDGRRDKPICYDCNPSSTFVYGPHNVSNRDVSSTAIYQHQITFDQIRKKTPYFTLIFTHQSIHNSMRRRIMINLGKFHR